MGRFTEALKDIGTVAATVAATCLVFTFILINAYVPSGSMEDTIMTGDRVFGTRITGDYGRGDIVIFRDPDARDRYLIKRIIGLPGETLSISGGKVYIDGEQLEEDYIKEPMDPEEEFEITVPEGGYFMMGDNRNASYDARYWEKKIVYADEIAGKALIRYWPVTRIKVF